MAKLISTLLRRLADVVDRKECDRPDEILEQLLADHTDASLSELSRLSRDIDDMQQVIGCLAKRIESVENERQNNAGQIRCIGGAKFIDETQLNSKTCDED